MGCMSNRPLRHKYTPAMFITSSSPFPPQPPRPIPPLPHRSGEFTRTWCLVRVLHQWLGFYKRVQVLLTHTTRGLTRYAEEPSGRPAITRNTCRGTCQGREGQPDSWDQGSWRRCCCGGPPSSSRRVTWCWPRRAATARTRPVASAPRPTRERSWGSDAGGRRRWEGKDLF